MKQPELGKKLAELRQHKNLTQEELVEACNVSVRTIQRIESGEVMPRISTVKILLSALETDMNEFDNQTSLTGKNDFNLSSLESWMQIAWISGLVYFIVGFVDTFIEMSRMDGGELDIALTLYLPIKFTYWLSYLLFLIGFAKLGGFFQNNILPISCYILVGLSTLQIGIEVISIFVEISDANWIVIGTAETISFGATGIVFGIGLLKLQDAVGTISKTAGILEITGGICLVVVILFLVGFVIYIPAIILEIIILFKGHEYVRLERLKASL